MAISYDYRGPTRGSRYYLITADGNCLYRALAKGLYGGEEFFPIIKHDAIKYVKKNWAVYKLLTDFKNCDDYEQRMKKNGEYGSLTEIMAISTYYRRTILIVSQGTVQSVFEWPGPKDPIVLRFYHNHYDVYKTFSPDILHGQCLNTITIGGPPQRPPHPVVLLKDFRLPFVASKNNKNSDVEVTSPAADEEEVYGVQRDEVASIISVESWPSSPAVIELEELSDVQRGGGSDEEVASFISDENWSNSPAVGELGQVSDTDIQSEEASDEEVAMSYNREDDRSNSADVVEMEEVSDEEASCSEENSPQSRSVTDLSLKWVSGNMLNKIAYLKLQHQPGIEIKRLPHLKT